MAAGPEPKDDAWMTSEVQRQKAVAAVVIRGSVKKKGSHTNEDRLLRKDQSSGSDTMLEILNNCIVFHWRKNIHQCLYIGGICARYK